MPAAMTTVFGGTGFLGSAIVEALLRRDERIRVATRQARSAKRSGETSSVRMVRADVRDEASVQAAVKGARAVIDAVGLYVERGADTFESVHVRGAEIVARAAARAGVERLVHISGIGARADSASTYVCARALGEDAVNDGFSGATLVRPSVLFGPGDSFLGAIDDITRLSPVFPLFGSGNTRLQPVFVGDVAEAVARIVDGPGMAPGLIECGGPRVLTYREVVETVLRYRGRRRVLLPIPLGLWAIQARALALLPNPPLTEDQVILIAEDNVVGDGVATMADLNIVPEDLEAVLPLCFGGDSTRKGIH